ncbi:ABC transporter permease [Planctomycetota bacterium]
MTILSDIKYAFKQLLKTPGFTAVALVTLGLCIGANVVIFAMVDAFLLRPLPFPQADRLVTMYNYYPKTDVPRAASSIPNYYNRREGLDAFDSVSMIQHGTGIVGQSDSGQRVEILRVSPEFFETLGSRLLLGRAFTDEETTFQTHHVAILSHGQWQRYFQSDPKILGSQIRVNGFDKTVVGILPAGFRFLSSQAQVVLPLSSAPNRRTITYLHNNECELIGRLKPGVTLAQAQAQIDAQNAVIEPDYPYAPLIQDTGFRAMVASLHKDHVAGVRSILLILQGASLFLFVIGAVNLMNLLLVRTHARSQELTIRRSLGASGLRIAGQLVTEIVALLTIGALSGLCLGSIGLHLLSWLGLEQLLPGAAVILGGRIVILTLAGALLVGTIIGLSLTGFALRGRSAFNLSSDTRSGTWSPAAQRWRQSFVIAQISLTFILLTGAGLLSVSLQKTMALSPGFQPEQTLTGHISLVHKNYLGHQARAAFAERICEKVRIQPGTQAVGLVSTLPLAGHQEGHENRNVVTVDKAPAGIRPTAPYIYAIVGDYFQALGIPLQQGRPFDAQASERDRQVCIVDETFAQRYWPENTAVGQSIYYGPTIETEQDPFTIVGIVASIKQTDLTEEQADGAIYFPMINAPMQVDSLYLTVRTRQVASTLGVTLQKVVRSIEPELPLFDLQPMERRIHHSLFSRRSPALLTGLFASTALILATIGTYGVLSYAVAQRRREIGVRMALGAVPQQIAGSFLSQGLRLLLIAIPLGLLGAYLTGRAMQNVLYQVQPTHIGILVGTAVIVSAVSCIACLLPAWRASRIEPMEALRYE